MKIPKTDNIMQTKYTYDQLLVIPRMVLEDAITELKLRAENEYDGWKMSGVMDGVRKLETILKQSSPIIPLISAAFDKGYFNFENDVTETKQDYLSKEIQL